MPYKNHDDKIGKKFGKLTLWAYYHKEVSAPSRTYSFPQAYCVCDCGNFAESRLTNVVSGKASHCGCDTLTNLKDSAKSRRKSSSEDLLGRKFNSLTVLHELDSGRIRKCICACDCGNFCVASVKGVLSGNNKSCGCAYQNCWEHRRQDTDTFIDAAREVHNEMYTYDLVNYTNSTSKVEIGCPVDGHGTFWQTPSNHKQGAGCPKCRSAGYNTTLPGQLYVLISEGLVKVGITNKSARSRINAVYSSSGIKFKEHITFDFEDGELCATTESTVLKILRSMYTNPQFIFDGYTEVFCTENVEVVVSIIENVMKELQNDT